MFEDLRIGWLHLNFFFLARSVVFRRRKHSGSTMNDNKQAEIEQREWHYKKKLDNFEWRVVSAALFR